MYMILWWFSWSPPGKNKTWHFCSGCIYSLLLFLSGFICMTNSNVRFQIQNSFGFSLEMFVCRRNKNRKYLQSDNFLAYCIELNVLVFSVYIFFHMAFYKRCLEKSIWRRRLQCAFLVDWHDFRWNAAKVKFIKLLKSQHAVMHLILLFLRLKHLNVLRIILHFLN